MDPMVETKFISREEKILVYKIVLVGNTEVGKTTLIQALAGKKEIERGYSVSLPLNSLFKSKERNKKELPIIGRIYDLRSQRYFPVIHSLYYHGTRGAIIVFDVTNRESFNAALKWQEIIWSHVGNVPILLCGNKSDLRKNNDMQVKIEEAKVLAKELSKKQKTSIPYIELSALENIIAYCEIKSTQIELSDIYPTTEAFRQPFIDWLIEIVKKGRIQEEEENSNESY